MILVWKWIRDMCEEESYVWVDLTFIADTPKAILIMLNSQTAWISKGWIIEIKKSDYINIKVKIFEYHWAIKAL